MFPFTESPDGRLVYPPDAFASRTVRVTAAAGCGKTSTLEYLARAHPGVNFLYTAFNKCAACDAACSALHCALRCTACRYIRGILHVLCRSAEAVAAPMFLLRSWTSS